MENKPRKRKIINDPVYGFISIPDNLVFEVMEHPWFQRLKRIKQLGLTNYVYPCSSHSRFEHAVGAMHLMSQAIEVLQSKGHHITEEEKEGVLVAILLHDIGHGPFSHTLEHSIVHGITHEDLGLMIIHQLNNDFNGRLSLAIDIFRDTYKKRFLHQLVSSQLDMDRLDYLSRDSFFTGVAEGVISTHRIITMLDIHDDELVVEAKGIYSIENFIISRRLMYWQVYFHKTVMAAEYMLINILKRAKFLCQQGDQLFSTPALFKFLKFDLSKKDLVDHSEWIEDFIQLDDYDIFAAIKVWRLHPDKILAQLCQNLLDRKLLKVFVQNEPFSSDRVDEIRKKVIDVQGVSEEDTSYFIVQDTVTNKAYSLKDDKIKIRFRDGSILDITEASDQLNISVLSTTVTKYVLCHPKFL